MYPTDIGNEIINIYEFCLIENLEFIQRDKCFLWFHINELIYIDKKNEYYCKYCNCNCNCNEVVE